LKENYEQVKDNFEASEGSEGKEEKKYNANK
jgi:hypothetical protein